MTLLVCRTCPRYDVLANGAFRRAVAREIAANPAADTSMIRHVHCLGGCPEDGVAAVDAPCKARVRFTGLDASHAEALIKAAHAHEESATGVPGEDWEITPELQDRISSVTVKRQPRTDNIA
ncbi:hypothetical protein [Streptomyces sp. NPDC050422]|uniref:hypothetical protein n=1 Tax=Streptomyces sp. NPDC050422 TaxID=3365614 RepID=UPI0037A30CC6